MRDTNIGSMQSGNRGMRAMHYSYSVPNTKTKGTKYSMRNTIFVQCERKKADQNQCTRKYLASLRPTTVSETQCDAENVAKCNGITENKFKALENVWSKF